MNLFDLLQGAAGQAGLLPEPPVGRNPGLHPHGSRTRSDIDPLQAILGSKQNTLQNLRSPLVRRSAGGRVVDENEPEGLDWLEANGPGRSGQPAHSWDQPKYSPFNAGAQGEPAQAQMTQSGSGVRAMMGPYGGGFSTGVDPAVGEMYIPKSPYRMIDEQYYNPLRPTTEPMMADEKAALTDSVQDAYNETVMNPRQGPATQQQARKDALGWTNLGVKVGTIPAGRGLLEGETNVYSPSQAASQPGSVTMPTTNPSGTNAYTPFEEAKIEQGPMLPRALADTAGSPLAANPSEDYGYFDQSDELLGTAGKQAVLGDRPGLLPMAGRALGLMGTTAWDALGNALWRSGPSTTESTTDYINWLMQNRQNEPRYSPLTIQPEPIGQARGGIIQ